MGSLDPRVGPSVNTGAAFPETKVQEQVSSASAETGIELGNVGQGHFEVTKKVDGGNPPVRKKGWRRLIGVSMSLVCPLCFSLEIGRSHV